MVPTPIVGRNDLAEEKLGDYHLIRLCSAEGVKPGALVRLDPAALVRIHQTHEILPPELPFPVLVTNVDGRYFCMKDECSHRQTPLSDGVLEGYEVECSKHFSRFDLRTGKPDGLPARNPVPVYDVTLRDGDLYVDPVQFQDRS